MSEWKEVKLKNCISTLKGYAFKSAWYVKKGTPIIRVSDFSIDSVNTENLIYVNSDIAKTYSKYALIKNDVIIQTVGSWASNPASVVGKVIKIPNSVENGLLNQNAVKLIPNTLIDKKYLFYLLKGELFKGYVIGCAQGAASQASITLETIYNYHFLLPPLPTQKRISNILSNYDNLIENNQKRIEILEKMAQNLYKEWFVRFRFPNWESVEFVDGLPIGWEKIKFKNFTQLKRGYDLPNRNIIEGNFPIIASTNIKGYHNQYKVEPPCITTGRSGSLGTVQFINQKSWVLNTSLYVKDFKGNSPRFIYYTLKELHLERFNAGAGVPTLNRNHLDAIKIIKPTQELQKKFEDIINSFFNQIENLQQKNNLLKQERNRLLPRLLSGKLEV